MMDSLYFVGHCIVLRENPSVPSGTGKDPWSAKDYGKGWEKGKPTDRPQEKGKDNGFYGKQKGSEMNGAPYWKGDGYWEAEMHRKRGKGDKGQEYGLDRASGKKGDAMYYGNTGHTWDMRGSAQLACTGQFAAPSSLPSV